MFSFADLRMSGIGFGWMPSVALVVVPMLLIEWFNRGRDVPLLPKNKALRWCVYAAFTTFIL